jgi:nuclear pore complex protein Nup205
VVHGKALVINSDFARQVIFLSQQLDCSERYIAGLLQIITTENPNIGTLTSVEFTIAEFHQRRRYLVDCLRIIFDAALAAGGPDSSRSRMLFRIGVFVRQDLTSPSRVADGQMPLAHRVFKEIKHLGQVISEVQVAKQTASSDTTLPSHQGLSSNACIVR